VITFIVYSFLLANTNKKEDSPISSNYPHYYIA
jgi:hypothetical protein